MIGTYRKRPTTITATRWTGNNFDELAAWCDDHVKVDDVGQLKLYVAANAAWLMIERGEWIARDRHGFYPIKDDVFIDSYEQVNDGA